MSAAQPAPQDNIPAAVSRNPATGEVLARYPFQSPAQVEALLAAADAAFRTWREMSVEERARVLAKLADVIETEADDFAAMITREMGKTLREAKAEVAKCAKMTAYYAEHGPAMIADERAPVDEADVYVSYLPTGTILGIMPWNFPLWQALRAGVPITLGGNAFLLKHAPNCMGLATMLGEAFERAGAPKGLFGILNVDNGPIERVIADDRITGVTLTGSPRAGAAVAALAGKYLKKSVLELGGSDAFIVLKDADLDKAVEAAVASRYATSGQVCIAAKRLIVEAPVAEAFTEKFLAAARKAKTGDPNDASTTFGPLAREDLRDELHDKVERSVKQGAKVLLGGKPVAGPGAFYEPTVLADVRKGVAAFDEETFGPVAAIVVARDADHAIALANDSEYGLGGALWTNDLEAAKKIARKLETGGVFVNGFTASDPRVPIGGVKKSGYGRELSHFGIKEFLNAQTVWIKPAR